MVLRVREHPCKKVFLERKKPCGRPKGDGHHQRQPTVVDVKTRRINKENRRINPMPFSLSSYATKGKGILITSRLGDVETSAGGVYMMRDMSILMRVESKRICKHITTFLPFSLPPSLPLSPSVPPGLFTTT